MSIYDRWHKKGPNGRKVRSAEYGKGMRWQVRWTDVNGEPQKRNFPNLQGVDPQIHAEAFDAQIKTHKSTGTSLNIEGGKKLVSTYAEEWRTSLIHRDSTQIRNEYLLRAHILPLIGQLPMAQVGASHMRSWIKDRKPKMAPSTLAAAWTCMEHMFKTAVLDRIIGISPCEGVQLPSVPKAEHYIPSAEQVHVLAREIDDRFRGAVYTGAGTGARYSEIFGLEPECFDPMLREVDIRQQLVSLPNREPYLGPVKSANSLRTLEVPRISNEALAWHIEHYPPLELEMWDKTDPDERKWHKRTVRLIFPALTVDGLQPMRSGQWSRIWRPAADKADIKKGVGIHCLRHYFATLMIAHGKSVKTVQLLLGHANPTVTLNTYAGYWPESEGHVRSVVDEVMGSLADHVNAPTPAAASH